MFKTALMMTALPVALSAAIPAKAAVALSGPILLENMPASIAKPEPAGGGYTFSRAGKELGFLAISRDPKMTVTAKGGPERIILRPGPGSFASIMPEPTSWMMMLFGMGVAGWSLRGRHQHNLRHVSFV